jgi:diguanylate cyclase (GGDEF)-like protein
VLRALAALLKQNIRTGDLPYRYGGEEFLLLLPGATLAASCQRAESIRADFAALRVPCEDGVIRGTLSVGAAVYPQHGQSAAEVLAAADQALYQAKRQGRDRVVCAC